MKAAWRIHGGFTFKSPRIADGTEHFRSMWTRYLKNRYGFVRMFAC